MTLQEAAIIRDVIFGSCTTVGEGMTLAELVAEAHRLDLSPHLYARRLLELEVIRYDRMLDLRACHMGRSEFLELQSELRTMLEDISGRLERLDLRREG